MSITSKFQVLSDLYIDSRLPFVHPVAPYLLLAGNIGNPASPAYYNFLSAMSVKFQLVFVVLGNKEYEVMTLDSVKPFICNQLRNYGISNVHVLDNGYYDMTVDDVRIRIIGSTMWPHIAEPCIFRLSGIRVKTRVNYINFAFVVNLEHRRCFDALANHVLSAVQDDRKVILLTHYIPSYQLVPAEYHDSTNIEYMASNDLWPLFGNPVVAWFYGHSSRRHSEMVEEVETITCAAPHIVDLTALTDFSDSTSSASPPISEEDLIEEFCISLPDN